MRTSIAIVLLAACGGSSSPKTAVPPTTTQAPPPMQQPAEPPPAPAPTPATAEQPAAPAAQDPAQDAKITGAFGSITGTGDIASGVDDADIYGGLTGDDVKTTGTLGKGSGNMKPRVKAVPTVRIGQPVAEGDLDKAIIRRYIKRNIQKIQYCYEKELLDKPKLGGATVTAKFTITTEGKVTDSEAKGLKNVDACVAMVISAIEFPKPKSGTVKVTYPFVFTPAGN